jgi:hypothetical protein
MQAMNYSAWGDTAHLLHMTLQMMGKVKLERMRPQPEWNQVVLDIVPQGFATGLIPYGMDGFEIVFDVVNGALSIKCTNGREAGFRLDGALSVSTLYDNFNKMLGCVGFETEFNPAPQEHVNSTVFFEQKEELTYRTEDARNYFECCTLAYSAITNFSAAFRGKKIQPSMFWGTFDMTVVLLSGEEAPFPGEGKIEQTAFDEKMIEFGFWPGDPVIDQPNFFALAYPFVDAPPEGLVLKTPGAYFSAEKMEFFLPLAEVLKTPDPVATVESFCTETFAAFLAKSDWKNEQWFAKPLL